MGQTRHTDQAQIYTISGCVFRFVVQPRSPTIADLSLGDTTRASWRMGQLEAPR
jgi:hypothetical protein